MTIEVNIVRKGSLQLSINAIVILIMAIALLGVGIFFINSVLGDQIDTFAELPDAVLKQVQDELRKSGNQFTVWGAGDGQIELGQNDKKLVHAVILNTEQGARNFGIEVKPLQPDADVPTGEDGFLGISTNYLLDESIRIDVGETKSLPITFESTGARGAPMYKITVFSAEDASTYNTASNRQLYQEEVFFVRVG